jgi:hypothetical protein
LHTVNLATCIQNNSITATDNIFVVNSTINLTSLSPTINDLSAYDAQFLTNKNVRDTKQIPFKSEKNINIYIFCISSGAL